MDQADLRSDVSLLRDLSDSFPSIRLMATPWEIDFCESLLSKFNLKRSSLTESQRTKAREVLDKYVGGDDD